MCICICMYRFDLVVCSFNSFYRFVLEPEVMSGPNDSPSLGPVAKFGDIPESPLLTLNMITPEGWLVEIVQSNCDLDNIHLKDVSCGVRSYRNWDKLLPDLHSCRNIMVTCHSFLYFLYLLIFSISKFSFFSFPKVSQIPLIFFCCLRLLAPETT